MAGPVDRLHGASAEATWRPNAAVQGSMMMGGGGGRSKDIIVSQLHTLAVASK